MAALRRAKFDKMPESNTEPGSIMSDNAERNRKIVRDFWKALYEERDYEKCGAFFTEDGRYVDVPTPDFGAVGPRAIARRLKMGLGVIPKHVHHLERIVAEGDAVITEHNEDWHFDKEGEHVVNLPFVSVQILDAQGKITSWSDYWNNDTLLGAAPRWWLEHIAKFSEADFDADADIPDTRDTSGAAA